MLGFWYPELNLERRTLGAGGDRELAALNVGEGSRQGQVHEPRAFPARGPPNHEHARFLGVCAESWGRTLRGRPGSGEKDRQELTEALGVREDLRRRLFELQPDAQLTHERSEIHGFDGESQRAAEDRGKVGEMVDEAALGSYVPLHPCEGLLLSRRIRAAGGEDMDPRSDRP